jgi:hypothetical protein
MPSMEMEGRMELLETGTCTDKHIHHALTMGENKVARYRQESLIQCAC